MSNPLIQAYRKPALYINIPSNGKFYSEKPHLSVDDELAVYAMTARDELVTKTPDALFNGEATISLLQSCTPDIEDPGSMPVSDLMVVLLAIRQASYGDSIDVDVQCPNPECKILNQLSVSSSALLATIKPMDTPEVVKLENDFKIRCKPYTLNDRTKLQVQRIKQQKLIEGLSDAKLTDEERQTRFGRTFVEIADLTVGLIANCIVSVTPPDGDTVKERDHILEWLKSITKKDYDVIKQCVENLSNNGIDTKFKASCQGCNHQWETTIDLDMANFFAG